MPKFLTILSTIIAISCFSLPASAKEYMLTIGITQNEKGIVEKIRSKQAYDVKKKKWRSYSPPGPILKDKANEISQITQEKISNGEKMYFVPGKERTIMCKYTTGDSGTLEC